MYIIVVHLLYGQNTSHICIYIYDCVYIYKYTYKLYIIYVCVRLRLS